ncbi:MAG TPA: LysM peptidoglycan-binding domain-containing protein [Planctomycetota bacterium]|nr:LysM peptidoglycan-binding domain-containing protein [Planctomycetota bacterium]
MPKRAAIVPISLALIALAGCDGAGVVRSADGQWLTQSAASTTAVTQRAIADSLAGDLGPHWRAAVAITPDPERDVDGEYRWSRAEVRVALVGDGQTPLPEPEQAIADGVRRYMARKVDNAAKNLVVAVASATDATRFARLAPSAADAAAAPPPRPASTPAAAAPASRASYVIQAGDTLAAISAAFYGSTQHWRRIADANPGLDPGALVVGATIAIPPGP